MSASDPPVAFGLSWRMREREARLLADALRGTRLTVVYAAAGSSRKGLLTEGLVPLLARRETDVVIGNIHREARVFTPFVDRREQDEALGQNPSQREIAVRFSDWSGDPLAALIAAVWAATPPAAGTGEQRLVDLLEGVCERLDARVMIVLDDLENFLDGGPAPAQADRFVTALAETVGRPDLSANVLLVVDERFEAALEPFRLAIPGFDDSAVRLIGFVRDETPRAPRKVMPLAMPLPIADSWAVATPSPSAPPAWPTALPAGLPAGLPAMPPAPSTAAALAPAATLPPISLRLPGLHPNPPPVWPARPTTEADVVPPAAARPPGAAAVLPAIGPLTLDSLQKAASRGRSPHPTHAAQPTDPPHSTPQEPGRAAVAPVLPAPSTPADPPPVASPPVLTDAVVLEAPEPAPPPPRPRRQRVPKTPLPPAQPIKTDGVYAFIESTLAKTADPTPPWQGGPLLPPDPAPTPARSGRPVSGFDAGHFDDSPTTSPSRLPQAPEPDLPAAEPPSPIDDMIDGALAWCRRLLGRR